MGAYRRILVFTFCSLLAAVVLAQTPAPSPADAVSLSAIVSDAQGRAITGLTLSEFRILEDRVEQTVLSVKANTGAGDYTLTYAPKNSAKDGTWRSIQVEIVGLPRLTVRHTSGYRAP